jgi:hypothetical protein
MIKRKIFLVLFLFWMPFSFLQAKSNDDVLLSRIKTFQIVVEDIPSEFQAYETSEAIKSALELEFFQNGLKVSDSSSKEDFWNYVYINILPLKADKYSWAISYRVVFYVGGAVVFDEKSSNKKKVEDKLLYLDSRIVLFEKGGVAVYGNVTLKSGRLREVILDKVRPFIAKVLKSRD